jgi:hypothetical protein
MIEDAVRRLACTEQNFQKHMLAKVYFYPVEEGDYL